MTTTHQPPTIPALDNSPQIPGAAYTAELIGHALAVRAGAPGAMDIDECEYCGARQLVGDGPRPVEHITADLLLAHRAREACDGRDLRVLGGLHADVYDLLCELDSSAGGAR